MARKAPDQDAGEALRRFKSDLKAGTLGNFYIISGEEAFLRSHYVDLITKKIADGPAGEFNCHRFSADDCTPQALADAIDAMPMMAERTLVRVDDVDLFKQPEGAREQYAAIFSDLPDYCCVLFVYDTVEFKTNGTMKKLASAIREHENAIYRRVRDGLLSIPDIRVFLPSAEKGNTLLFTSGRRSASAIAAELAEHGICTRSGMHCSPFAHKTLGTGGDAVRASFSVFNTPDEADRFLFAVEKANASG